MNKELLENRLAEIERLIKQMQANFNALEGAKQEVLYWLNELNKKVELKEVDNSAA